MKTHSDIWKPIEQCPKVKEVYYLLRYKNHCAFGAATFTHGYWWITDGRDGFATIDEQNITHFAEMPEFEVK